MALVTPGCPRNVRTSLDDDILSSLPEPLIHHIFSFLETIDIIRASAVSRRWRSLWISMPYLNFDIHKIWSRNKKLPDLMKSERFKDFINWVLMSQNSSVDIQKFRLRCFNYPQYDFAIYRWICFVARRNVQELELSLSPKYDSPVGFPHCLITSKSLVSLNFGRSQLLLTLPSIKGFSQLKSLVLRRLKLHEHLNSFGNFISSCPLLENLHMESCIFRNFKILDISSHSLKNLTIDNGQRTDRSGDGLDTCQIRVACSNLVSLALTCPLPQDFSFEELNSLETVLIHIEKYDATTTVEDGSLLCKMLQRVSCTEVLKLSTTFVEEALSLAVGRSEHSFWFNNLKSLTLNVGGYRKMQSLFSILDSSPYLETLRIIFFLRDDSDPWRIPNWNISCLTHNIKKAELYNIEGDNALELVRYLLKNGHSLETMIFAWRSNFPNHREIVQKVQQFPRSSSNVRLSSKFERWPRHVQL